MHAICFTLGPLTIRWYGVMMALGFMAALASWTWLGRRRGLDSAACSDLLVWVMVAGIVGARALYVLQEWPHYAAHPLAILRVDQGGLVFYGGFLGAVAALVLYARRRGMPVLALFDFATTALPLGHVFGRIGCFMNGCCHGSHYNGWLAVRFPPGSQAQQWHLHERLAGGMDVTDPAYRALYAGPSDPIHPVQLYEAFFNLALYGALVLVYRREPRAGTVTNLYLLVYPIGRFLLEFLRGDDRPRFGPVSISQSLSLVVFVAGLLMFAWRARRRAPAAAAGPGHA